MDFDGDGWAYFCRQLNHEYDEYANKESLILGNFDSKFLFYFYSRAGNVSMEDFEVEDSKC